MLLDDASEVGSRSLCADPLGEYVCAISLDGRLKVHYVPPGPYAASALPDPLDVEASVLDEPCTARDDGSAAAAAQRGLCAWHPTGRCLALAGRASVLLKHRPAAAAAASASPVDRSVWREEPLVGRDGPPHAAGFVLAVAWSPCGRFLASAGLDRCVVLWDVAAADVAAAWVASAFRLMGLAFVSPAGGAAGGAAAAPLLALADGRGRVGVWGVNPDAFSSKRVLRAAAADSDDESPVKMKKSAAKGKRPTAAKAADDDEKAKMGFVSAKALLADDDDDFDFNTDDEAVKITGQGKAAAAEAAPDEAADAHGSDDKTASMPTAKAAVAKPLSAKARLAAAMAPAAVASAAKDGAKKGVKRAAKAAAKAEAKKAAKKATAKRVKTAAGSDDDEEGDASDEDLAESEDESEDESDDDNAAGSGGDDDADVKAYAATDKDAATNKQAKVVTKADLDDDSGGGGGGSASESDDAADEGDEDPRALVVAGPLPAAVAAQAPFMPSASPLDDERRYLCWNAIGTITSRAEGLANAVEIEFADAASRRAVHAFWGGGELFLGLLLSRCAHFVCVLPCNGLLPLSELGFVYNTIQ